MTTTDIELLFHVEPNRWCEIQVGSGMKCERQYGDPPLIGCLTAPKEAGILERPSRL